MVEGGRRGGLVGPEPLGPAPERARPGAAPAAERVGLVEDVAAAEQELGEPLPCALQVLARVVERVASRRARNAASRLSFLRLFSAAGFCILDTAPTAQSTPSALSWRQRAKPVGPLS